MYTYLLLATSASPLDFVTYLLKCRPFLVFGRKPLKYGPFAVIVICLHAGFFHLVKTSLIAEIC